MKQKLVDKEKLRMELRKLFAEYPNLIDKGLAYAVEDVIDEAPIVEAEPVRHGKWIECESENGIHFHKCSECGQRDMYQGTFTDWNGRGFSFYFKRQYCPVCGALMDEVNDDSK